MHWEFHFKGTWHDIINLLNVLLVDSRFLDAGKMGVITKRHLSSTLTIRLLVCTGTYEMTKINDPQL